MDNHTEKNHNNLSNTVCGARWGYPLVDFSKGEVRTCCRTRGERITSEQIDKLGTDIFLNSDYQKEKRSEMLNGIRHHDCNTCWVMEDAGMQSARFPNQRLPPRWIKEKDGTDNLSDLGAHTNLKNYKTGEEIVLSEININSSILKSNEPYMLEINLSNACDLKCSYCSPYFSSKWEKDMDLWAIGTGNNHFTETDAKALKHNIRQEVDDRFMDLFWEWFNGRPIETLGRIGIIGGEPLINKNLPQFLNKLIESYKKLPVKKRPSAGYCNPDGTYINDNKPLIWFVTNLNTPRRIMDKFISEHLPQLCEHFHVEIHASLESVGKRIEYTRDGLDWELYKENAEKLCAAKIDNFHFGFQIAINALSISTLTEFLKYAKYLHDKYERSITLKQNMVTDPQFHSPSILPVEFADYLEEALNFLSAVKDDMRHVNDPWGTWASYYSYIETIHESIKSGMGEKQVWASGSLNETKITFFKFFSELDKRRGSSFLKTFPEYSSFFYSCKEAYYKKLLNVV